VSRTTALIPILAFALAAGVSAAAAQVPVSDRVAKVMSQQKTVLPPLCKAATGGSSKINDLIADFKVAVSTADAAKRTVALAKSKDGFAHAIESQQQGDNAAAWIYLGRAYLYQGDLTGADTAFARAEKLAPDCKDETERSRQMAWTPLVNDGVTFANANNPDSASVLFHQANAIYRGSPSAYANLGVIYANKGQNDTAMAYFKQAADIAGRDTTFRDEQKFATLNLGIVQARSKHYDEAIASLEAYRTLAPDDKEGGIALHSAYCGANQDAKAQPLEKQYGLAPCSVAGGDASSLVEKGVAAFNANKFDEAAAFFGQAYAKQPYNHDALLNQATAYFKVKNGPKLVESSTPLVALEPLNEVAIQLLEQGYRETKQTDKQVALVSRRRALPAKLETKKITISPTDITVVLIATGRDARDAKDQVIKAAPVNLTFELLGADGAVVVTQDVTVPALAAGATQDVTVSAKANGITGWRYKVKA
jgi:tetratricopeptide (TPR) repeat protein